MSLKSENPFVLFPSKFTSGEKSIVINGLVWMGDEAFMKRQIEDKIAQGFTCIKMKIGAIDFEKEIELLRFIRQNFDEKTIETCRVLQHVLASRFSLESAEADLVPLPTDVLPWKRDSGAYIH